jgi:hypothetical protein
MKRTLFGLFASVVVAGSLVAAQDAQQPASRPQPSMPSAAAQAPKAPDLTLTGCLVQGSSPNVFILENAKTSTDSATAKGTSYVLDASGAVDFKSHLNNQVRVVGASAAAAGSPSSSAPSAGSSSSAPSAGASSSSSSSAGQSASSQSGSAAERTMAKLTARTVTKVADTCPAS